MRRLTLLMLLCAMAAACAGGRPARPPVTAPEPPVTRADAEAVVQAALALQGVPYRNGGADPRTGFDCSGLVQFVYREAGVALPRETRLQFSAGRSVKRDDLAPGDLVFFSTVAPGASHVGIAIDRDRFVHAPSSRGVMRVERIESTHWRSRYVGARRLR